MFVFRNCSFHHLSGFAVDIVPANGSDHLSALAVFENCRFYDCQQLVRSYADTCSFRGCWFYSAAGTATYNLPEDKAAFVNWTGNEGMYFDACMFVPDGAPAHAGNRRWIDNRGIGGVYVKNCRFGYEGGGRPIVHNFTHGLGAATQNPVDIGKVNIVFESCPQLSGGAEANDGAIVMLRKGVPNKIVVRNCSGPAGSSIINESRLVREDGVTAADLEYWLDASRCQNYKLHIEITGNNYATFDGQIIVPDLLKQFAVYEDAQYAIGTGAVHVGRRVCFDNYVQQVMIEGAGASTVEDTLLKLKRPSVPGGPWSNVVDFIVKRRADNLAYPETQLDIRLKQQPDDTNVGNNTPVSLYDDGGIGLCGAPRSDTGWSATLYNFEQAAQSPSGQATLFGVFGKAPQPQQGKSASGETVTGTWDAAAQEMLQKVYNALKAFGFIEP
jgi:hypothetical protein